MRDNLNKIRFTLIAISLFVSMYLFADYSLKRKNEAIDNYSITIANGKNELNTLEQSINKD